MPAENDEALGRRLLSTLEDVNALIPKTKSSKNLKNLRDLRKQLLEQIGTLVDKNLDAASREYQEATTGLKAASTTIQHAIKGIESVAQAIKVFAQAIELVSKLAAAA